VSEKPWLRFGIFVGGRGARMGYVPKGLLHGPHGATLVERLLKECELAVPGAARVLVGDAAAYTSLGLPSLPDEPPGIGPLGGLRALLQQAARAGERAVIALACDMPFVSAHLLRRLSLEQPEATAFAPRQGERWEPLCARYDVSAQAAVEAALAAGERSLQKVFARVGDGALSLALRQDEVGELRDWDEPADLRGD
jgi:molybdopterin-guanine dinucleotide biosynthesis protein A